MREVRARNVMHAARVLLAHTMMVGLVGIAMPAWAQADSQPLRYLGAEAVGSDGKRLGVVDNLLVGADGAVEAVLIKNKIYMGLSECFMAVPWKTAKPGTDEKRLELSLTYAEFMKLPEWEPKSTPTLKKVR